MSSIWQSDFAQRYLGTASQAVQDRFTGAVDTVFSKALDVGNAAYAKGGLINVLKEAPGFIKGHAKEFSELRDAGHAIFKTWPNDMQRGFQERVLYYTKGIKPTQGFSAFPEPTMQEGLNFVKGYLAERNLVLPEFSSELTGALDFLKGSSVGAVASKRHASTTASTRPDQRDAPAAHPGAMDELGVFGLILQMLQMLVQQTPLKDYLLGAAGLEPNAVAPNVQKDAKKTPEHSEKAPLAETKGADKPSLPKIPGAKVETVKHTDAPHTAPIAKKPETKETEKKSAVHGV